MGKPVMCLKKHTGLFVALVDECHDNMTDPYISLVLLNLCDTQIKQFYAFFLEKE